MTPIYTDVEKDRWSVNYINFMAQKRIVFGVGDKKFEPERPVTIAEFCAMAIRAAGIPPVYGTSWEKDYTDPSQNNLHWAWKYTKFAATNGYISASTPINYTHYNVAAIREEAFFIAWMVFTHPNGRAPLVPKNISSTNFHSRFNDGGSVAPWCVEAVIQLYEHDIVHGYTEHTIEPLREITREQACKVLARCISKDILPVYISPYKDVKATVTSPYGYRTETTGDKLHRGFDMNVVDGQPIVAIEDGTVIAVRDGSAGNGGGSGYNVIIKHEGDPIIGTFCSYYTHLKKTDDAFAKTNGISNINKTIAIPIKKSVRFGEQGETGSPGSNHLHFQTWYGGNKSGYDNNDPAVLFNPLKVLYGIEMTPDDVDNSGIFQMYDQLSKYSWTQTFLNKFQADPRTSAAGLNNATIIRDLYTFLDREPTDAVKKEIGWPEA